MCGRDETVRMTITIPASISRTGKTRQKLVDIDSCIAPIVKALNDGGVVTVASCCGHGHRRGNIVLADGRWIDIYPDWQTWGKANVLLDEPDIHGEKL